MTTSTEPSRTNWRSWPDADRQRLLEKLKQKRRARENDLTRFRADPLGFATEYWPDVRFYDKQQETILSVRDQPETVVVAGNQLGKDYTAGFICLWAFLCHDEARIITTSVKDDHLRVLWGEIGRFLQSSRIPLTRDKGGPLVVNHRDIRKIKPDGTECKISYLRGMVSERGEGMAGHHAAYTLLVVDEASGVDDLVDTQGDTWAKRKLIFGNPNPTQNFFRRAVKEGSQALPDGRPYRKVIRIRAEDSPNVKERRTVYPGVLTWEEYQTRRARWNPIRQKIGLDAEFYEGAEVLLYPSAWLDRGEQIAASLRGKPRKAKAVGIDPAEGGDKTSMCAVDEFGVIELVSKRTPDTSVITSEALAFCRKHGVAAEMCSFDRGGGGKQHADRLRAQGFDVRTIAFGESVMLDLHRGMRLLDEQQQNREERYAYVNRRAEMAGEVRTLLEKGYGIPAWYPELRQQMSAIPLTYDGEGRLKLPPKNRRDGEGKEKCLVELVGHSPDEFDSLCLAVHTMLHEQRRPTAGVI